MSENLPKKSMKTKESKKLFGAVDDIAAADSISRSAQAMPYGIPDDEKYNLILSSYQEMNPKNIVEARLCTKETALYTTAMHYMGRAERSLESEALGSHLWHETYINLAIKLLRLHNETVQTLEKVRRGGEQKMVVQHVNVEGGQNAFMTGNFQAGEGRKEKIRGMTP